MLSVIRKQSFNSVQIFWLDRDLLRRNIDEAVRTLCRCEPQVRVVVLFGSLAEERAVPRSDVDLMILVSEAEAPYHERASRYAGYFENVGLGVDLFVYTTEEAARADIPLARTALRYGTVLYGDTA